VSSYNLCNAAVGTSFFKFINVKNVKFNNIQFCSPGSAAQRGPWPPRNTRFLDHTQRHATVGRTPLDE
jgi:hypothetical protein